MRLVTRGGFKPPSCANCKLHIDLFFTAAFMRSNCKEQVWIVEHQSMKNALSWLVTTIVKKASFLERQQSQTQALSKI